MRGILALIGICGTVLALLVPVKVWAQESDQALEDQIKALQEGQNQIRKELQEIKTLLQTRAPARSAGPNVKGKIFDLGDNPIKGERTAKITLVEFTDYQ